MSYCIGIDVGGTTSTIAIGNSAREVVHVSNQFGSRTSGGPTATIESIATEIKLGLEKIGVSPQQITDIGLSTPGPATLDGILLKSPNLDPQLWHEYPLRASLEQEIRRTSRATVHYIGDGQAAALGEYSVRTGITRWGTISQSASAGAAPGSLFMVIVGTGLGGGEVVGGQAVRGKEGRAGHAGHIFLPPYAFRYQHDRELVVGNARSTLESAVSLTALTHQLEYRLTLEQWRDHPLHSQSGSVRDKAKQLRDLAGNGDALSIELFNDQAKALGIGLLAVNYLGDYDLLVIGGGVCDLTSDLRNQYKTTAEQAYRQYALDGFANLDRFEFSVCGDEAPVIGALSHAYLAMESSGSSRTSE